MNHQLIPKWAKLNFAVLPIGDNFTMCYANAAIVAQTIECRHIAGVQPDRSGFIKIDHEKARNAFAGTKCILHLPAIGETINL